tara:strand:+ start:207 stop:389 length:183 start_codon:yes stop_codon:yes gene_type:complete
MMINKTESKNNNINISKSKLLNKVKKKLSQNNKISLNKGEKYLSPVFSTMSGATYNFENF